MGLLSVFGLGKAAGEAVATPVEAIGNVFDKLFTSDEERAQAEAIMEKLRQQPALVQAEINRVEAGHRSVFVAGWRPFLGWIGGCSLASFYLPKHIMAAYVWCWQCADLLGAASRLGAIQDVHIPAYPIGLDDTIMELLLGLLGLAGMRTVEKIGGKTK
ncbi:holin family protein [Desulfovibrio subterraneus]|uniref:3TM-type holin n=1 Tax=Desulfovibrio subterraneus TaxID=2718620 RepID=UPI0022B88FE7|nr:3TM-type holin [Desulfovibrio subterraneus]WBF68257.1 holin family protein [Desulfovibrio subterraneus]